MVSVLEGTEEDYIDVSFILLLKILHNTLSSGVDLRRYYQ